MTPEAMEALLRVLDATPEPPLAQEDPADVIAGGQKMMAERQERLEELQRVLVKTPKTREESAEILQKIQAREAGWQAALQRARHELAQRVVAARNIRKRYGSQQP